ncbi:hypothetical protein LOTGIDRAFT_235007 [Lottia gigantea]|uniref:HAUS augmin-like complex subunit 6 N-terminal domain-containing protein n=1 Tax=Lottia gigantea TaxID=225164 RepID=V3Z9D0_LOTGI|nr:hypothetical protein LOTGIDRAFT_235007 [Lottia gigantea]ESO87513.1 hypothetical protein LOTGIDRAFT_235007 [Lottia gigantea]
MANESDVFGSVLETDYNSKEYDIKQAFFTNLLLLGFEAKTFEMKYRIPFTKDMFNLPNKTGSEAVLYFLFNQLNPVMCKEEFRCICFWPISNKKDEQLFRRACNNWLINIQKEEPDSHLPRVAASLLMSPGGNKFYEFLFSFSNYVLCQVIKRDNGVKSVLGFPELCQKTVLLDDVIGKTVQCSAIRCRKQYFRQLQQTLVSNNEWKEYSSELVNEYRQLTKKIRDLERDVRSEMQAANEKSQTRGSPGMSKRKSFSLEYDLDSQSVRRTQRIQKVREMWRQVEKFQSEDSKDREIIQAILDEILSKNKQSSAGINATDLNIKIPDILLRECETEIHRRQVDNTYKGGKVNLLSLIQLWNLSLHLYIERLQNVSSKDIENENSSVIQQLHTHNAHLINAQGLREKLSEDLLPELKQSISSLRTDLDTVLSTSKHRTPNTSRTMTGFELSTATPPVSFTPQDDIQVNQKPSTLYQTSTQDISTPEAANEIIDTVLQTSRKTINKYHQGSPIFIPSTSTSIPVSNRNTNSIKTSKSLNSHLPSKPNLNNHKKETQDTSLKSSTPIQKRHMPKVNSKLAEEPKIKSSPFPSVRNESRRNTPAKTKRPKSHDILVDKIVSAVVDGTSLDKLELSQSDDLDINLLNPIAAQDDGVFVSQDKIRRSPEGNDQEEPQPNQQGYPAVFTADNTRIKLSFTDDVEPLPSHQSTDLNDTSSCTTVIPKNTLTITEDNDSGLLTVDQQQPPFLHNSPSGLQSPEKSEFTTMEQRSMSPQDDMLDSLNSKHDSLLNLHDSNLDRELPSLVVSSPMESDKPADLLKSGRKSDIFGKLKLTSEDDLDDIFNTKTPRILRKTAAINSVDSSFSETDQVFTDRIGHFDSLQDDDPVTLRTFSPPKPSSDLLVDFNSSWKKQTSSANLDVATFVDKDNSSDIENEEFPDLLDINESFSPVKKGIKLVGISPGKTVKHVSPSKSSVDIAECRKAASETLNRFSIEIDDLIAQTDRTIHDKEQLLSTSLSDELLISDLSEKYLRPVSSHQSSRLSPDLLDQDIFGNYIG